MSSFVVAIIGRPNVGKSSLFNCLMQKAHRAITHDRAGVTRDRHYGVVKLNDEYGVDQNDKDFILIDTGGFYPEEVEVECKEDTFFNLMASHAYQAMDEADLVLWVLDVREGVTPQDQQIRHRLSEKNKDFVILLNKYDHDKQSGQELDFFELAPDEDQMLTLSCAHGRGLRSLKEIIGQRYNKFEGNKTIELQAGVAPAKNVVAKVALIGAPNAGKSTLLNQLIGAQRALVSDIPGTTVDPIQGFFDLYFGPQASALDQENKNLRQKQLLDEYESFKGQQKVEALESPQLESQEEEVPYAEQWRSIHLVDTAGIRKKNKIHDFVENQSVYRSLRCITESDIVILMVDARLGISHQDRRLLDVAYEKGKSIIVALNKMDLLSETLDHRTLRKEWLLDRRDEVPWLHFCELIPISAKEGRGIKRLKKALVETIWVRNKPVSTGELNRVVTGLLERNPIIPKGARGKRLKLKYSSMVKTSPPTFLFFTNKSKEIPSHYRRYLQNALRSEFNLVNSPVHIIFRSGASEERAKRK